MSSSLDHTIRQWDADEGTQTGPLIRTDDSTTGTSSEGRIALAENAAYAGFSPDGRQIIAIGSHTNRAWDAGDRRATPRARKPPPDTVSMNYTDAGAAVGGVRGGQVRGPPRVPGLRLLPQAGGQARRPQRQRTPPWRWSVRSCAAAITPCVSSAMPPWRCRSPNPRRWPPKCVVRVPCP